MPKQYLTCKFKLHNPSAHKRAVMDHALLEYTRAYAEALAGAQETEAAIVEQGTYRGKYTGKSVAPFIACPDAALHSSAKDSLLQDAAGNLASYFQLLQDEYAPSFPIGRDPSPEADDGALDHLCGVGADQADFDLSSARCLKQMRGRFMPLFFCRADGASQTKSGGARNRNFSLVVNVQKRQLLAAMWLLPTGHELCRPLGANEGNLVRIDTGEAFVSNSSTAIFVPLQMGRNGWQEHKFLDPSKGENVSVKTAFLVKDERSDDYYLHVAFEFDCPERYEPEAYLGIDKGILFTAAYALVDDAGAVMASGHFDDDLRALQIKHGQERERLAKSGKRVTWRHYKTKAYDNILHALANSLIDMAKAHNAGIVVEDLNVKVRGGRVVSRFRKLDGILDYKCKLAGVPFRRVFAAYSSVICHRCGGDVDRDDRAVTCPACGYEGHSDDNAAVNIARRALYRKSDWNGKGGYRAFHRAFANAGTFPTA